MKYECQNCDYKFEGNELSEDTMGEPRCPECGNFYLWKVAPEDDIKISDEDSEYTQDGFDLNEFYYL